MSIVSFESKNVVIATVEPQLSELIWGEGYLYNRIVRKIGLPTFYAELCSTTLIKHTLVDKIP